MNNRNTRLGIALAILTTMIFAVQDGISRHLAETYNIWIVVMIRFWFFGLFAMALAARSPGGLGATARTPQIGVQIFRGLLLAIEIAVIIQSLVLLGLVETHAVFASAPLLIAALSGPILGEKVGWRRWVAIGVGFVGILVILQPGTRTLSPAALVALLGALLYAIYILLTRYVSRRDGAMTSFLYTGTVGAVAMTPVGLWFWEPMTAGDWGWMAMLCLTGSSAHWLVIRTYEMVEASVVQPFVYFQLVFTGAIGIFVFNETVRWNLLAGTALVVAAGLFTLARERAQARQRR